MSNRTSRTLKGSITGVLQNVLAILFQLIITPMILTYAGQGSLGGYVIIMQVVGYGILLDFGFSVALTRFLCQAYDLGDDNNRFRMLLTVGRNVLLISNTLIFLLLLIAAFNVESIIHDSEAIQSQAKLALVFMAIWMVLRTPLSMYNVALTATQDMATTNVITLGGNLVRLLTALMFTYWGFGLPGLIMSNILAELIQFIAQRAFFRKKHTIDLVRWGYGDAKLGKEMLRFGISYCGVNLAVILFLGSDNIIAGALYGAATASVFYSTKMFGSLVIQFITRIIDSAYPALNELIGKNDYANVRHVYLRMLRYILLMAIPSALGIALFTEPLVTFWLGEKQYAGYIMALSLSLFTFVQILNHLHGTTVLALGNLRHWSLISISSGLFSVALGYFMGKVLGMQWILLGITVGMLPILIFLVCRVLNMLEIKVSELIVNGLPALYACISLLAIIWCYDFLMPTLTLAHFSVTLTLYCLLWITGTWFLGLNTIEKTQVRCLISSVYRRA